MKDLEELVYFLGIQVTHTVNEFHLSQQKYIKDLLGKTKMLQAKDLLIPMTSGLKISSQDGVPAEDAQLYRSAVGALQYVTVSKPKLAYSVDKICQFMKRLTDEHWKVVKRVMRHLTTTMDYDIHLKKAAELSLIEFSDVDWIQALMIDD